MLGDRPVKGFDFLIHGPRNPRLDVDNQRRRFPYGPPEKRRRVWESWSSQDDIDCLSRWAARFGAGYQGLLAFTSHLMPEVELAADTPDLFEWRGQRYL